MKLLRKGIQIVLFFIFVQISHAQLGFCTGNSGNPIFTETFGTGIGQNALPAGTTSYTYANGVAPEDGFYAVSNTTNYFDWFIIQDHTAGDSNGKMLVINSDVTPGQFYRTTITGLCANTSYEFSSWLINLTPSSGFCGAGAIPINVSFEIWDASDTTILASGSTGNIGSTSSPIWRQYGLVFSTSPGQTSVILKMRNNGNGGCGNDLAIDDIVFKSCGDAVVITNASGANRFEACEEDMVSNVPLTATPDFSVFMTHAYQWQVSSDTIIWNDVLGETNNSYNAPAPTPSGSLYYRVKFAETAGNLQNASCNSLSESFEIKINALRTPAFNAIPPICNGDSFILPPLSNNSISGTWTPAANNTATTTYTFTPAAGQCASIQTLTVVVNQPVTPTFNSILPICNGETFNLPPTSTNSINGVWSPAINNTATTTYTFTPNATECATTTTLTVVVNQSITPTFNVVPQICSGELLSALPMTSINNIMGTWSPAINNTATTTYTFTPNAGQCATTQTLTIVVNPPATPTFITIPAICDGDNLMALPMTSTNNINGTWSPALDNTTTTTYTFTPNAGQCATTQTLTIVVNPIITPTFDAVAPICSGESLTALPTTSLNNITGTWSPALNNTATTTYTFTPNATECATTNTLTVVVNQSITPTFNAVPQICSGELLSALPMTSINNIMGTWSPAINNTSTTTYTFTPNAGQCATTQTLTIVVNSSATPTFNAIPDICEGDSLVALPTVSTNNITGTWSPALDNTTTTTYTFTPNAGQCATTQTLTIVVNPIVTPTFDAVAPICSGEGLTALPTTSLNNITGTWSPALNHIATTTYTFTPNTGECATAQTLTIVVNQSVTPTFDPIAPICIGETISPLPTTSTNSIMGTWSPELDITTTTTYTFTPTAGQCAILATLTIIVNPKPLVDLDDVYVICINTNGTEVFQSSIIMTGLSETDYSFEWTNSDGDVVSTDVSYLPLSSGVYSVLVTDLITGCQNQDTTTVIESSPPLLSLISTSNAFASNEMIEVSAVGNGIYEYSLDNGPWQDNPIFTNVTSGNHSVSGRDKNGCGFSSIAICLIGAPKFFTPNGDGFNETWNIKGISCIGNANIFIYDRFGKLLKQLNVNGQGWNGTFNGNLLPSDDYWFVVRYLESGNLNELEFKGHFTLKR